MIFLIINLVLCIGLILFSVQIDTQTSIEDTKGQKARPLVDMILWLVVTSIFFLIVFISMLFSNTQLISLCGRITLFTLVVFVASLLHFCLTFSDFPKNKFHTVLQVIICLCGAFFISRLDDFAFDMKNSIVITGNSEAFLGFTWLQTFVALFFILIPVLSFVILFFRSFGKKGRIYMQQIYLFIASAVVCCGLYYLLYIASKYVPMYSSLFILPLAVFLLLVSKIMQLSIIIDLSTIVKGTAQFSIKYVFSAVIIGLLFAILLPLKAVKPVVFWIAFVLGTSIVELLQYFATEKIKKMNFASANAYEDMLEAKLSKFDYNQEPETLISEFVSLMKEYTETTHVEIMLETESGIIKSVYTSEITASKDIPQDAPIISSLSSVTSSIIFRQQAKTLHEFSLFRDNLNALFEDLKSDALIVLREGRHMFGFISLGAKRRGNFFSDYDKRVFSNLYSYFFLFGFYMKNIANQSVVGTVDREIQFSSQVIRSIQENVDKINVPSVDVGYISQSARSLGGDFIDFIRLNDNRYMMIMGDVSGKGLNASMSMVILKSIIRTFLIETADFKELIEKVNHFIKYNLPRGTFFAGLFTLFDFTTNTMYYANCGLPVLFLYTESYNNVIEIQGDGKVLGFMKKISNIIKVKKIKLNPGDIVLACTDGLLDSESLRGEMYGKDRVQKLILDNKTFESGRLVKFLFDDMLQFTSKDLQDDVTAVAVRMLKVQE
ncbi:MAG: SpoIIE family protein phosphatase [Spirochaetaceae bacterium]|nr:SpoIIE family protein phosphatase [Spirochaetaceae bacterium]